MIRCHFVLRFLMTYLELAQIAQFAEVPVELLVFSPFAEAPLVFEVEPVFLVELAFEVAQLFVLPLVQPFEAALVFVVDQLFGAL